MSLYHRWTINGSSTINRLHDLGDSLFQSQASRIPIAFYVESTQSKTKGDSAKGSSLGSFEKLSAKRNLREWNNQQD